MTDPASTGRSGDREGRVIVRHDADSRLSPRDQDKKVLAGNLALRFLSASKSPVFSLVRAATVSYVHPPKRKSLPSPILRDHAHIPRYAGLSEKTSSTQAQDTRQSPSPYFPTSTVFFPSCEALRSLSHGNRFTTLITFNGLFIPRARLAACPYWRTRGCLSGHLCQSIDYFACDRGESWLTAVRREIVSYVVYGTGQLSRNLYAYASLRSKQDRKTSPSIYLDV